MHLLRSNTDLRHPGMNIGTGIRTMRYLFALAICFTSILSVAQTPKVLDGLEYRGTSEATFQEGCEGCGNPGHVEFEGKDRMDFTLPGADIIGTARYTRKGNLLRLVDSDWTIELKGDSLFFTAYEYRHTYRRVRK